jgi:hypothetical protein
MIGHNKKPSLKLDANRLKQSRLPEFHRVLQQW